MPYSPGQAQFKMSFEISAVSLSGGIASNILGGMLPLMSVLQALSFAGLTGGGDFGLDEAFAYFRPLPNTSLIENQVGHYPFANLAIAANAVIRQPLMCSMLMICPVKDAGGYAAKLGVMTSLQNTLANHCAQGGTFNIATPAFFFTDMILLGLHDVSGGESNQAQLAWKWDLEKPLISQADAAATQNQLMSQISNGLPTNGAQTGANAVSGSSGASPTAFQASAATPSAGLPSFAQTTSVPYQTVAPVAALVPSSPFSI
ncbi:MAG: hypothetical protein P4M15_06365 [Alphaproteobacteria bacterium]|nr:hypothetical protein [Alphaproteobacteria bacterium]